MPDSVDDLWALPLDEFTPARNELAKRLADPEIRKLKKPSVSAWAVNQLARRREVDVQRLIRVGERLEHAQRDVVRGGDQKAFDEARREERDAVRRLRAQAADLLRGGGHPATDATLERLSRTLHAAAATSGGRQLLREGRLVDDLEPLGFGVFEGVEPRVVERRPRARVAPPPRRVDKRLEKARADLASAREAAEAAAKTAREAERAADSARRAATRAAERVTRLETRVRELER